jgi:hypothetical protein
VAKAASNKLKAHKNTGFVAKAVLDWLKAHKNTEICGKKPLKDEPLATKTAGFCRKAPEPRPAIPGKTQG